MNVLVIAPHPDDEAIGCGGTVCLHADRGDRVAAVFLTSGELGLKTLPREQARQVREREARKAARILGLANVIFLRQPDWTLGEHVASAAAALRPVLEREAPGLIYLPHPQEEHPDHRAALAVLQAALPQTRKGVAEPRTGGRAERSGDPPAHGATASPTLQHLPAVPVLRAYEVWTPLAEFDLVENITAVMPRKLRAVRAHGSQVTDLKYDRAVRGLNQFRGELSGQCRYAEVFRTRHLNAGQPLVAAAAG